METMHYTIAISTKGKGELPSRNELGQMLNERLAFEGAEILNLAPLEEEGGLDFRVPGESVEDVFSNMVYIFSKLPNANGVRVGVKDVYVDGVLLTAVVVDSEVMGAEPGHWVPFAFLAPPKEKVQDMHSIEE